RNQEHSVMEITRKVLFAIIGAVAATSALFGAVRMQAQSTTGRTAGQAPAAPPASVAVVSVVSQTLDRPVLLPGDLLAFQDVEIRPKVTGFVETIAVDRGSVVKKGQLMARMVAPELAAHLSEAESKIQSVQSQRLEAEAKLASDEG